MILMITFLHYPSVCRMMLHTEGRRQISAKNRITVNLEAAEYRALQQIATRSDRSLAWLGRRAICDFLERESVQLTLDFPEAHTTSRWRVPK